MFISKKNNNNYNFGGVMESEEYFGINAGKVWHALKKHGELGAKEIAGKTELKITEVFGALGWLGREGKLNINMDERGRVRFSLKAVSYTHLTLPTKA